MCKIAKKLVKNASLEMPSSKKEYSALEHPDMQELIAFRGISESDYGLIDALSHLQPEIFIDYHNFFNFSGVDLTARLQNDIDRGAPYREYIEIFLSLSQKYDYYTCNHINRVFERINRGE